MTEPDPTPTPDIASLQQQLTNLQTKLGEQGTELGNLRQQNQTLKDQLASTNKPAAPTDGEGGSLYDWSNGTLRDDSGNIPTSLYESMQKAGASKEQVDALVSTVETAKSLVETRKAELIQTKIGGEEQFQKLNEWAAQNSTNPRVRAAANLAKNIDTLDIGLDMLKEAAESSGFTVGVENPPAPTGNEPSKLPTATAGNINPTLTPLDPKDPNTSLKVAEAYGSGDSEKIAEVEARLKLGMAR